VATIDSSRTLSAPKPSRGNSGACLASRYAYEPLEHSSRASHSFDLGVGGQLRKLSCLRDCGLESSDLVDESVLLALETAPNAPFSEGRDLVDAGFPALRDPSKKKLVHSGHRLQHPSACGLVPLVEDRPIGRPRRRLRLFCSGETLRVNPKLFECVAYGNLPSDDADRLQRCCRRPRRRRSPRTP